MSGGSPPSSDGASPNAASASRQLWTPDARDVSPQVKLIAAEYVETTVNQPAVEVVFAQYGGILTDRASVLVVTHPWPAVADPDTGTTYDVPLVRSGSTWSVTEIHPSNPGAPATNLSSTARQVLGEPASNWLPPIGPTSPRARSTTPFCKECSPGRRPTASR